jgi:hypothetical protein
MAIYKLGELMALEAHKYGAYEGRFSNDNKVSQPLC